jgi:ferritin-like metal-binding protein YciE
MPVSHDTNLNSLFTEGIRQLYWIEKHTADMLPDLQEAAASPGLKSLLAQYLDDTREHLARLNSVFGLLREKPRDLKCKSISAMLREAAAVIPASGEESPARDAALTVQSRMIIHYQISCYSDILLFPQAAGLAEVARLLADTLTEEKEASEKLAQLLWELDPALYTGMKNH